MIFGAQVFDIEIFEPPKPPTSPGGRSWLRRDEAQIEMLEAYAKYLRIRLGEPF